MPKLTSPSRRHRPGATALLLVLGGIAVPGAASATVWTVGAGPECNTGDLQAAIDAAAASSAPQKVIQVAKDQTYTNVHLEIYDASLHIVGGFSSCGGPQVGQTRLSGAGDPGSVIEIIATAGREEVTLERLVLSGGRSGGGNGNGVQISGPVDVVIDSVVIDDNEAYVGGGVDVAGSPDGIPRLRLRDTTISSNQTGWGGAGIACREGAEVIGEGNNTIIWNRGGLPLNGGGILAASGCNMLLRGHHRIAYNRAARGGGIRVGGARLELVSDETGSVYVESNWADWDAAGLYVSGQGTELLARNVRIRNNDVLGDYGTGSGLLLDSGALALIEGAPSPGCPSAGRCSVIENNDGLFSAVHVGGGARLEIRRTWIQYHDEGERTLDVVNFLPSSYGDTSLTLESVVLHHNAAHELMRARGAAELVARHITVADNEVATVLRQADYAGEEPASGSVSLSGSIVWEQPGTSILVADDDQGASAECNLVHETTTLPAGSDALVAPPQFANPTVGDYHLTASSAALDFCVGSAAPTELDVDGEERGVDAPSRPPRLPGATIDAGADEFGSAPPALFRDGFESGDLSAWSS